VQRGPDRSGRAEVKQQVRSRNRIPRRRVQSSWRYGPRCRTQNVDLARGDDGELQVVSDTD